ncbi:MULTISPECIES: hypothetical protein [unclassified Granulicatella]|uniref:hypothetical protein n=1 Tax=unclassified Granulicatella TaxID=2630493 RepID=UPI0010742B3D|nr:MULTISPECIES: hypothetical protein [unclassified Granulicatella]MBF0781080.1 hypothetical protein [Granulicatella sp. 19428wC4_WM01]TFU92241.1 hypothetical protein E4T68_08205 [Granulicatella sp. WM01]
MNKKQNILDAWITMEQFSEGDIRPRDKSYKLLCQERISKKYLKEIDEKDQLIDWKSYFVEEMNCFIQREKISPKKQGEVALIMYFGIFDFSEVVEIIREKYQIEKTQEELNSSFKFSLSLTFDKNLNSNCKAKCNST